MFLKNIYLNDFRCFSKFKLAFENNIVLIEGANGSGKTSILEALYYSCYLKSFRTRNASELISQGAESFFCHVEFESEDLLGHNIQVGVSNKKKSVKINNKAAKTYKEIIDLYRVISLTEDDIFLIKGYPEKRRAFIDRYILLHKPELLSLYKRYKKVLENRQALFYKPKFSQEDYDLWTRQLWELSKEIRIERVSFIEKIEAIVSDLLKNNFPDGFTFKMSYSLKNDSFKEDCYEEFKVKNKTLIDNEIASKRGVIGAHFDDIIIDFNGKSAKLFGSRGQQKLLVVLIKIAQIYHILNNFSAKPIFLLDDFVTDFDNQRVDIITELLLKLNCQVIFTCPIEDSYLKNKLLNKGFPVIKLGSLS